MRPLSFRVRKIQTFRKRAGEKVGSPVHTFKHLKHLKKWERIAQCERSLYMPCDILITLLHGSNITLYTQWIRSYLTSSRTAIRYTMDIVYRAIHMYIVYIAICACTYMCYIYLSMYISAFVYTSTYIDIAPLHRCVYVCGYIILYIHIYIFISIYTYTCISCSYLGHGDAVVMRRGTCHIHHRERERDK